MAVNQCNIMSWPVSKGVWAVDVKLDMLSTEELLKRNGLQVGGSVQKLIDNECMKYMVDYMPRRQAGELAHMMVMATVIGSGQIDTPGPYAHYLHEGVVYVDPKYNCAGWISNTPGKYFGQWYSRKGVIKEPTNRELQYTGAPMRGKKWFNRMKADHKDDILQAAQELIGRGGHI